MKQWLQQRGLPRGEDAPALGAGESKWPKEIKPLVGQVMRDLAILRRAAEVLQEPIYVFGTDLRDYFNTLAMATSELHKLNIIFVAAAGDLPSSAPHTAGPQLIFVSEKRLGFGTHGASNIAQRFSEAILYLFRRDSLLSVGYTSI